jgi:hypothetical protein
MTTFECPELTFVLREAPTQSGYAGQLCGEVRVTGNGRIIPVLRQMGLIDDESPRMNILEKYQGNGFKILRFVADAETYRYLHSVCSPSNIEEVARITDAHLANLSIPTAEAELMKYTRPQLKQIAMQLPSYETLGSRPSKKKLAQFITNAANMTNGYRVKVA